ncbi:2-keto-4-pentenoate hydratase/2-oxohepta-3-ene-1,7-dioic acid hydratase (catechol pathway) [Pseudooceanicola antarcticus]|uniref:2-keto-4-pentenoate hydratase/2-oxohepta-3-ene-1,7-dioic acid hydratase (Catechol pathway) n=1 Tax=Pseudooceanicola antarcticus TaxID=1247613 RepID=A0A285IID4_9RHOB|nr:fumarylacetoacetate hydrolase family protein [Pseudooceanicola antarcticus]PJE28904.1 FAA hydrolase family protein [Pseudooceanicola antarcticus]SNY47760.1 2-keto-4-pentenoate hydratase/2-oxohepta-3-ene-1,7-dioic acid hydratase (catechol pathway) [Pseudooceanicola antarcticus]
MKLVRYGDAGQERPGLIDSKGELRDLSAEVADIDGAALAPETLARLAALDTDALPRVEGNPRLGPCVGNVGKLIGIGLNYSDHAAESGMAVPSEPIVFLKATSAISGPYDDVQLPAGAEKVDWEVELAFVIGTRAKNVSKAEALSHVAGYMIVNDVSERSWQAERQGQWTKGKSHDTFAPMGPWMVTADEVADPHDLGMRLDVDGERRQDGSSKTLIFGIDHLVSYLSTFMTLEPGDVVTTGTPPGVGLGMTPQVFLRDGQVMRLEIDGLGVQQQTCVRQAAPTGTSQ